MPKILVVDDNAENRDSLSRRLERRGYNVILAVDGKEAVSMAGSDTPDLILMDLNMPELDGWEATRQLKADDSTSAIPVIAMTAHALAGDEETAMEAGCNGYHSKPIDFPKLLEQIESMLKSEAA